jgi:hypothetical protein
MTLRSAGAKCAKDSTKAFKKIPFTRLRADRPDSHRRFALGGYCGG